MGLFRSLLRTSRRKENYDIQRRKLLITKCQINILYYFIYLYVYATYINLLYR